MIYRVLCACLLLSGCVGTNTTPGRALGMFVTGDLKNGEAIVAAARLDMVAMCYQALEPVAMGTPDPTHDGMITLITREMALEAAVHGPCASILAPILLKAIGKLVPAPFGIPLPF